MPDPVMTGYKLKRGFFEMTRLCLVASAACLTVLAAGLLGGCGGHSGPKESGTGPGYGGT